MKANRKILNWAWVIITLGITSFVIGLTSSINPWSKVLPHFDSAIFLFHGVKMAQGGVLYVDMWDHKGPVLFFIQWLGIVLTPHSLWGLWLLECLACFIALFFFFKTASLVTKNTVCDLLASVFSFHLLYYFGDEGNCVEQWALPFIAVSLYLFSKYLKTNHISSLEIMVAGAFMTCTFLMNGNLVSVWIAYVILIVIKLLLEKDFKQLRNCILFYSLGVMLIVSITLITLGIQGALPAFFETYFGFNAEYVSDNSLRHFITLVLNSIYADKWFAYAQFIFLVLLVNNKKWKDWKWSTIFFCLVAILMSNMSPRGYNHYYIQLIPCMVIPLAVIMDALIQIFYDKRLFYITLSLWLLFFGRYMLESLYHDKIYTIIGENQDMYMAGGDVENYTTVNEWLGHPWSDDDIDKWVINEIY